MSDSQGKKQQKLLINIPRTRGFGTLFFGVRTKFGKTADDLVGVAIHGERNDGSRGIFQRIKNGIRRFGT